MTALLDKLELQESADAERAAERYRELVAGTTAGRETDVETARKIMAAANVTLETFRADIARRQRRQQLAEQFAALPDAEREQRENTATIAAEVARFEELQREHVTKVRQLQSVVNAATATVQQAREAERQLIAGATDQRLLRQRDELLRQAERLSAQCTEVTAARQQAQRQHGNLQSEFRAGFTLTTEQSERAQKFAQTVREKEAERVKLAADANTPGSIAHARAAVEEFARQHLTGIDA